MSWATSHVQGQRLYVTDDTVVTIGTDVGVRAEHLNALNVTKTKASQTQTRRGHGRRIKKIIEWWMAEYPDYFEVGTRVLPSVRNRMLGDSVAKVNNLPLVMHHIQQTTIPAASTGKRSRAAAVAAGVYMNVF